MPFFINYRVTPSKDDFVPSNIKARAETLISTDDQSSTTTRTLQRLQDASAKTMNRGSSVPTPFRCSHSNKATLQLQLLPDARLHYKIRPQYFCSPSESCSTTPTSVQKTTIYHFKGARTPRDRLNENDENQTLNWYNSNEDDQMLNWNNTDEDGQTLNWYTHDEDNQTLNWYTHDEDNQTLNWYTHDEDNQTLNWYTHDEDNQTLNWYTHDEDYQALYWYFQDDDNQALYWYTHNEDVLRYAARMKKSATCRPPPDPDSDRCPTGSR